MADILINVDEGAKRVMNNTKLFAKLLLKFKDDKSVNELDEVLAAGDMTKAQSIAHTLKGLAANLSLTALYNKSLTIENQLKEGSVDTAQVTELKNIYNQTLTEADKVISQYA
jgi:HPt (histidine-containing phosphotransfer) domain-containing protein